MIRVQIEERGENGADGREPNLSRTSMQHIVSFPPRRYADLSDEGSAAGTLHHLWRIAKSDTPIRSLRFTWLPKPSLGGRLSAFL